MRRGSRVSIFAPVSSVWAAHGRMLFDFRASSGFFFLKLFMFSMVMILAQEVSSVS